MSEFIGEELETVDENIKREARRIAAAFGIKEWGPFGVIDEGVLQESDGWYSGTEPLSGWSLTWRVDQEGIGEVSLCDRRANRSLASLTAFRGYGGRYKKWRLRVDGLGDQFIARGLYRLGFEDTDVLAQLQPLSAHEKVELRLSMPREFWPSNWDDKEEV